MRYYSAWAASGLVATVIIGCGPGKELPDDIPRATSAEHTPKKIIPTVSDPVAKQIVDRAIKAHTQNNSGLLERGKISKVTADGTMQLSHVPGEFVAIPKHRTLIARWPDHMKLEYADKGDARGMTTFILRHPFVWWGKDTTPEPIADFQSFEEVMRTDGLAQHWLPLVFPLGDPKAVVFEPQKGAGVGSPPADMVRFFLPDRPVYRLHFSPSTGYLVHIEYTHSDAAGMALKEWILSDFQLVDGMMLPMQMKSARTEHQTTTRRVVEEWKVQKWEFPEKLDDSVFEPPNK